MDLAAVGFVATGGESQQRRLARFVRSVRARLDALAASSAVSPSDPSPARSVHRPPARLAPPVIVRRIALAPLRSAAPNRWHHEQKWVDRAPMTIRFTRRPQRGQ